MPTTVLLKKQVVEGFKESFDGVYLAKIESERFEVGKLHHVEWDGVSYLCTCTASGTNAVISDEEPDSGGYNLGNLFTMFSSINNTTYIYTRSTEPSHTVAVSLLENSAEAKSAKLVSKIKRIMRHTAETRPKIKRIMRHTVELGAVKIKRVYDVFIFFDAISNVFMKLKSVMISVPASEMDADKKAQTEMNAPLADHPAKGMEVKSNFVTSFSATLHAFRRAAAITIANIFASIRTVLTSSTGFVFKHQTETPTVHESEMESAESSVMGYKSNSGNEIKADGIAADSSVASAENESTSELKAAASANETATANPNGTSQNEHYSRVNTWYYPELVDGVLYIRQAYEATRTEDGTLEVK